MKTQNSINKKTKLISLNERFIWSIKAECSFHFTEQQSTSEIEQQRL